VGQAELERDDMGEREDGDLVAERDVVEPGLGDAVNDSHVCTVHGRILAHVGFQATVVLSVPSATLEP
jgi:hypothetical protein